MITLTGRKPAGRSFGADDKIILIKPPFFSPLTPPLGIAIMKSFLQQHNYSVECFDFNVDAELWGVHHRYFNILHSLETVPINEGYSILWNILNAHMLAYVNGADSATCANVLETIIPLYGIRHRRQTIQDLLPIVEKYFERLGKLTAAFDWSNYAVVGTSTYTTSLPSSLFILKQLKQQTPQIMTVMGGGVFADDLALGSDNLNTLVEEYPFVDHVILGEGELLMLRLLQGHLSDKRVISIADLGRESLKIEDVPVPDFSDFNLDFYNHLSVEGARSCPFQCSFCSETIQWGDFRKKTKQRFAEQLGELAQKYQRNTFFMGDSLMNPYIRELSAALLEAKTGILYDGYLRADKPVRDRERTKLWSRSGLYRVRLGIESASAHVLELMHKQTTPEVIDEVLRSLASAGIRTTTYWIVGFPGETEEDFEETLQFIRRNHANIYELETHPYYYYPYGQIGSRFHECFSLYPDDVIDIIKFKIWEIVDAKPSRREKYDRLHRISRLATELGVPNIYSMADLYRAEDRWRSLHPLMKEIYKGTRRSEAQLSNQRVPAPITANSDGVWAYRALISKQLNKDRLRASLDHLIRYIEMLQMNFEAGEYVPTSEIEGSDDFNVIPEYALNTDEDRDGTIELITRELSAQMQPLRGSSIRLALLHKEESSGELLLFVHRAIADSRSLVLLFQDLFSIYKQLSEDQEIFLRSSPKNFIDFITEFPFDKNFARGSETRNGHLCHSISLSENLVDRMSPEVFKEFGLTPGEVWSAALLRTLAKVCDAESPAVDVTHDYRDEVAGLENTVGLLTRVVPLTTKSGGRSDIGSLLDEIRGALRTGSSKTKAKILLNLEHFVDQPWFDDELWIPQGFASEPSALNGTYSMEIMPVRSRGKVRIYFGSQDTADLRELTTAIAKHLETEIDATLKECASYLAAQRFWLAEFSNDVPTSHVADNEPARRWRPAPSYRVDKSLVERVSSACRAESSAVMMAAGCLLFLRLSEREELIAVASENGSPPLPLRLYPSWSSSFRTLVHEIEKKKWVAAKHEIHAFAVLDHQFAKPGGSYPVFDIAYSFNGPAAKREKVPVNKLLAPHPKVSHSIVLIVDVEEAGDAFDLRIACDTQWVDDEQLEKLNVYVSCILEEVAGNADLRLGEIVMDKNRVRYDVKESLAREAFHWA